MAGRGHVEEWAVAPRLGLPPLARDALGASPRWTQASRPGREHVHPAGLQCPFRVFTSLGGHRRHHSACFSEPFPRGSGALVLTQAHGAHVVKLIPTLAVSLRWCVCLFASLWNRAGPYGPFPPGPQPAVCLWTKNKFHKRRETMQKQRITVKGDQIIVAQSLSRVKELEFLLLGYREHPEPHPGSCPLDTETPTRWKKSATWRPACG